MSLYAHHFQLLPRPDRTIFSLGSEVTRSTLPDFSTVEQLSNFTHRLLIWKGDIPGTFTQAKVGASIICGLIVIASLILARKIYEGSFWILRVIQRPAGRILVPNASLIFCGVEGAFGVIFIVYLWIVCKFFEDETLRPRNYILWLTLPWCGLIFGAVWAAWGTYFARPNALQSTLDGSPDSLLQRLILRPYVVNFGFSLFLPGTIAVSVGVPAIIANNSWQRALSMEQEWQAMYSNQTEFTQEMVQATQAIWFEVLKAVKGTAITYAIWAFHGSWVAVIFTKVSWDLIKTIRDEIKRQERIDSTLAMSMILQERAKEEQRIKLGHSTLEVLPEEPIEETSTEIQGNHLFSQAEMNSESRSGATFFPPVRPHHIVGRQQQQQLTTRSSLTKAPRSKAGKTQRDYLQSALNHVFIQLCAITPACVCYVGIAILHAALGYGKLEQPSQRTGGHQFENVYAAGLIAVTWTTTLFGGMTALSIAHKTYEISLATSVSTSYNNFAKRNYKPTQSSIFETKSRGIHVQRSGNLRHFADEDSQTDTRSRPVITWRVETLEEPYVNNLIQETSQTYSEPDETFFRGGNGRKSHRLA